MVLKLECPKNVKWTRTQLKIKGCALGEITGDYEIDGDLRIVFSTEDALADAFDKAAEPMGQLVK